MFSQGAERLYLPGLRAAPGVFPVPGLQFSPSPDCREPRTRQVTAGGSAHLWPPVLVGRAALPGLRAAAASSARAQVTTAPVLSCAGCSQGNNNQRKLTEFIN